MLAVCVLMLLLVRRRMPVTAMICHLFKMLFRSSNIRISYIHFKKKYINKNLGHLICIHLKA